MKNPKHIQLPSKNKEAVFLCLSSDSKYEPHLWVAISSIIDTAKSNSNYYIYILDGGINHKEYFYQLIKQDKRFHIEFIDMKDQFTDVYESRHVSKAAYYRLATFQLFRNFKKVIYIDADSYVLSDISELYNINIGNKLIAGGRDSITYEKPWREKYITFPSYSGKALDYFTEYLKLSKQKLSQYFSSGVLVFNLKNIDIDRKQEKLEGLLKKDYFCHDQDILNLLFDENETYLLRREWNYFNSGPTLKEGDFVLEEERSDYLDNKHKPKIISYVIKPWLKENRDAPYAGRYWEKLSQSPYYSKVLKQMRQTTKLRRFLKLSIKEKVKYLTDRNTVRKYRDLFRKRV